MKTKNWKFWMSKAERIMREDRTNLFDLIEALVHVADDSNYQKTTRDLGEDPNKKIEDLIRSSCGITFGNLRIMRKLFPKKIQWTGGDLAEMERAAINDAIAKVKVKRTKLKIAALESSGFKGVRKRSTITLREHEDLKIKYDAVVAENIQLKLRVSELESSNTSLRSAIDALTKKVG